MIDIPSNMDYLRLTSTYAYGLADPPLPIVSNPTVSKVAEAFIANVMRLKSMMLFHAQLADFAGVVQRINMRAEFEFTGAVTIKEEKHEAALTNQILDRFKQLYHDHTMKLQEIQQDNLAVEAFAQDTLEKGGAVTVMFATSPMGKNAFTYSLMSYLTLTWTAFETMAGDLWEAALNGHPIGLADLNGKRRQQTKSPPPDSADADAVEPRKSVRLALIRAHDWDTRNKMGTTLKGKYTFTTLAGIREAYECAFYRDYADLDRAIMNVCFDKLSLLRNVIVHKGAIADYEYIEKTKSISGLPPLEKGDALSLDGKLVSDLIHEAINNCSALLTSVDKWLADH
jgi:hypothetical protein